MRGLYKRDSINYDCIIMDDETYCKQGKLFTVMYVALSLIPLKVKAKYRLKIFNKNGIDIPKTIYDLAGDLFM